MRDGTSFRVNRVRIYNSWILSLSLSPHPSFSAVLITTPFHEKYLLLLPVTCVEVIRARFNQRSPRYVPHGNDEGVKFASSLGISSSSSSSLSSSSSAGTAIIVAIRIRRALRSEPSRRVQFPWSFRSFMVLGRKGYFIHFRRQLVRR